MSYIKNGVMYRDDGTIRSVRAAAEPKNRPVKNSGVYWSSGGGGSTGSAYTYTYEPTTGTGTSMWVGGGGGGTTMYPFDTELTIADYPPLVEATRHELDEHGLWVERGGTLLDDDFPDEDDEL